MWHAWERGENIKGFWWESPKKRDHLKDQDLREIGWGWCSGFTWLIIGIVGGLL
jgi:hypothetical protein